MASGTIRTLLNSPGAWSETLKSIPECRFEDIEAFILEKVIEYCHYLHKRKQQESSSAAPLKFDIQIEYVIPLMNAAHFLDL